MDERVAGRYRLVRPIARGGMAEVWRAHDETLDRDVAIKMLHAHLANDDDFVARFRREAVAVANLSHPNVVTVYDTGVETSTIDGHHRRRAYIVMELLRGGTLRALMNVPATERLSQNEAALIAIEVGEGIGYAHRQGVIHRDVKPGNIFVEPGQHRVGRVRVVDFGIAKGVGSNRPDEDLTQIGAILGTAKYVSPEQVEGKAVDARSDVYSLGIVLYEMTTGRVPFAGANDMATALEHVRSPLPLPRFARANVHPELEKVIVRALMKAPSDRYANAAEFVRALRKLPSNLDAYVAPAVVDDARPAVTRTPADRTPARGIGSSTTDRPPTPKSPAAKRGSSPTSSAQPTGKSPRASGRGPASSGANRSGLRKLLTVLIPIVGVASGSLVGITLADRGGAAVIAYRAVATFEVNPDGEHDNELKFLNDGDSTTSWSTETNGSRDFNGRKPGVGVVLVFEKPQLVRSLQLTSLRQGWNAQVFVSDRPSDTLAGWGDPRGQATDIASGRSTVSIDPTTGTYVMLWITDLGPKTGSFAQVKIADLALYG